MAELKALDMDVRRVEIPREPLMEISHYLDPKGPLKKDFRDGDSTWSLATEEELKKGLDWYKTTILDKNVHAEYIKKREDLRAKVGQTTSVVAFKMSGAS